MNTIFEFENNLYSKEQLETIIELLEYRLEVARATLEYNDEEPKTTYVDWTPIPD